MTSVYLASLLLVTGLFAILGYLRSLGAIPLYLRISQVSSPKASEIKVLRNLWSTFIFRKSPRKQDLDFLFQLPDFLDLFSVALSSGESVHFGAKSRCTSNARCCSKRIQTVAAGT